MFSKLKTLFWYLSRPSYYGQLVQLIRFKLFTASKEDSRDEATEWCKQRTVPTAEALAKLGGINSYTTIRELYADDFKYADHQEQICPVKMGGAGNYDLLYYLAESVNAEKVIETGVAYGWSSLAILLSLQKRKNAKLISTDMPYAKMNNEDYVGTVVPEKLKSFWTLLRVPDRTGLPQAIAELGTLDMCHYDSDKTYDGRVFAYPKLWAALRKGGVFISDDINDNFGFRDFAKQIGKEPVVVEFGDKYIGIILKD